MTSIPVDVSNCMADTTMTVTIRPTRIWLLKLRVCLGMWLIRAAAKAIGIGRVEFPVVRTDE